MDLFAYTQIHDLEAIANQNGIEIPRLRGYRLMKYEKPVSREEIAEQLKDAAIDAALTLCRCSRPWDINSPFTIICDDTNRLVDCYLIHRISGGGYKEYIGIRWDRIHGKKRKALKREIKKAKRRVIAQYAMWNQFAGREDVLYIHSRMGGGNWKTYAAKDSIISQPWFLGRVDDWYDQTYCDFYAKINPVEIGGESDET